MTPRVQCVLPVALLAWCGILPAADLSFLAGLAAEKLKESGTPGAAIAVVQGDRVVYQRAFGVANVETGEPVKTEMLFRLGSTTKMFTAAAVLALKEQGRVDLSAPISKYVSGLDAKIGAVTLEQLLSHVSGLGDRGSGHGRHDDAALGDAIRGLRADMIELEPGAVYSYSSLGYWIAGLVAESVAGKPFADVVKELEFDPLGMTRTTFRPLVAMTYPFAQQHEGGAGKEMRLLRPFADDAASWPGGSLFSSVEELSRFAIAFLNDGRLEGKQVMPPGVIRAMSGPRSAIPGGADHYGYGLVVSEERGVRTLSHGGARVGFGSLIVMAPEKRVAVIVVTNRSGSTLGAVAQKALESLVEFQPETPAATTTVELSATDLARYTGTYAGGTTRVVIGVEKGRLTVAFEGKTYEAKALGGHRFSSEGPWNEFVFVTGADGRIRYVHADLRTLRRME